MKTFDIGRGHEEAKCMLIIALDKARTGPMGKQQLSVYNRDVTRLTSLRRVTITWGRNKKTTHLCGDSTRAGKCD